ncbi:MAG: hypothetical protein DRO94_03230 [Candidatus Altiarchaeales archaeon]|nr:MAG: hypothetical protein DRO95_03985 [Candidatus Altiarchaeales archaeon]RLI94270.1 MAG: hypothetical protein DRO94_03230 [Candidatus Altiarchaeales archaeon]HDO82479.1 hypothetical protein [Candidatus Altiarchaeales archaeon]HEX55128.1 hypothetical protein [Candidatus Altiarchaeales archaeon]
MEFRYLEVREDEVYKCNAIHSTLLDGVNEGISPNTVFLEECPSYVLSLGRNQCAEEECNLEECRKLGIKIERRETGGGAGFMIPGNTAWGVCVRKSEDIVSGDMIENFKRLSEGVILGLRKLGLNANFAPVNDINIDDRKVGGMTALSKSNALLVYGSVIWDFDMEMYMKIAKIPKQKLKKKGVSSAKKRITTLTAELGRRIPPEELRRYLLEGFEESLGVKLKKSGLNDKEIKLWREKMKKFRNPAFIYRPGRCDIANVNYIHSADKGIIRVSAYISDNIIHKISLSGDFMQLNDVSFSKLEDMLSGISIKEDIENIVNKFLKENNVQLIGATSQDFIDAISNAIKQYRN